MKPARMLNEAAEEVAEAVVWYESMQPGLGAEFFAVIDAAMDAIEENLLPLSPCSGEAGKLGARRLLLNRFPYDVVVIDTQAAVIVVAVAHQARKPGYWRKRMSTFKEEATD